MKIAQKDIDRFWTKVNKGDNCWIWTGSLDKDGYGQFDVFDFYGTTRAHRISAIIHNIPNPNNKPLVLHNCPGGDNSSCVNPDHLFWGTSLENMQDKVAKNRQSKGSSHGQSRLTEKQVTEIRSKYIPYKYTTTRLAKEYNVGVTTIGHILKYENWKHI